MTNRIPLITFFLFSLCCGWAGLGQGQEARVKWVPDGDTLHLEDGRKVRLIGIDAPEKGSDGSPDKYYASESRDALRGLVEGRTVRMEGDSQSRDRYGRDLAYVYLPDGRMVNEALVAQGFAFFYPHPNQDREIQKRLLEAQNRAITDRRGFWSRILIIPDPVGGWTGNRRSMRFHHPDSHHAQRISARNRVVILSLEQAFRDGYAPARTSFPWPDAGK